MLRIVTVVDAESFDSADRKAQTIFEEAINLFQQMNFSSHVETLLPVGYCKHIDSQEIKPLIKPTEETSWPIGSIHHIANTVYEPIKPAQYIMAGRQDEATKAYLRSAYWVRMSKTTFYEKPAWLLASH